MAYHDDLLQQAFDLVHKNPASLTGASRVREALGRMFEHSLMKKVSGNSRLFAFVGEGPAVVQNLKTVAQAFGQLQDKRKIADYDNATFWTHTEALREVATAAKAFSVWQSIKNEKIAQDYLVSLLIKTRD